MAAKKGSPATAGAKPAPAARQGPAARKEAPRGNGQQATAAATEDPRRLMREAAWARMFGRTETKNPFTR